MQVFTVSRAARYLSVVVIEEDGRAGEMEEGGDGDQEEKARDVHDENFFRNEIFSPLKPDGAGWTGQCGGWTHQDYRSIGRDLQNTGSLLGQVPF